jgi:hypothetical protein
VVRGIFMPAPERCIFIGSTGQISNHLLIKEILSAGGFCIVRKSAVCGLFCICVIRFVEIVGVFEQLFSENT